MKKKWQYLYRVIFLICSANPILNATIKPQLVNIQLIEPTIIVDLFLADSQNFLGKAFYPSHAKAYIDKNIAIALANIQKELAQYGLGLKIKDAYRPLHVQKMLWQQALTMNLKNPENYFSDPVVEGGRHPRGIAVDVTLVRLEDHQELSMPPMGFTPEAHHGCMQNLTEEQIKNREFLKTIMLKHGFAAIACEWWHYNLPNWRDYEALDITFEELTQSQNSILVNIKDVNPNIRLDIRYATANNFSKQQVYKKAVCFVHPLVAEKLNAVQKELESMELGLLIWDGYRSLAVQEIFWNLVPDERYVMPPSKGSRHNRGVAVDCTLVKKDGTLLPMPTDFDDFSDKAHADYLDLPQEVINNRKLLQTIMCKQGFKIMKWEWWHFDLEGWEKYPLLNETVDC